MGAGPWRVRGYGFADGLRGPECVAQAEGSPSVEQPKEDGQVGAPGEQAEDESTAAADDLSGDEDDALDERAKVHAQQS